MSFGEYSVLGVSSDASEEDIRKAYFRKIREHPPETDAEGFQLVRKAYETLRDPRARADHDSLAQHGEQEQRS
jgi:curved DNA-binding protein CbpA